jgi:hypothetical protein
MSPRARCLAADSLWHLVAVLVDPWLVLGVVGAGLRDLHSYTGLSVAAAVATGGRLLRWEAPTPRRVLFVDGEMPLADIQARLNAILLGAGSNVPNNHLQILAADNCEHGKNLGAVEGQQALEQQLDGIDLLVIDNLSTLTSGSEGASDAWLPMQNWCL